MKNTAKLVAEEFEEIKIDQGSVADVERSLIKEHLGQITVQDMGNEEEVTQQLMTLLTQTKADGETKADFESRMIEEIDSIFFH